LSPVTGALSPITGTFVTVAYGAIEIASSISIATSSLYIPAFPLNPPTGMTVGTFVGRGGVVADSYKAISLWLKPSSSISAIV
jgi:hypothetical protein